MKKKIAKSHQIILKTVIRDEKGKQMRAFKKEELNLMNDLGLNSDDLYYVKLKAYLYQMAAEAINASELTHEEIARIAGTSRARISRLAKLGENSISLDFLIQLTDLLYEKPLVVYQVANHKLKPKELLTKMLKASA